MVKNHPHACAAAVAAKSRLSSLTLCDPIDGSPPGSAPRSVPGILQENPMDGGAWKAAVHGVAEGRARLSNFTFTFHFPARVPFWGFPGGLVVKNLPGTSPTVILSNFSPLG